MIYYNPKTFFIILGIIILIAILGCILDSFTLVSFSIGLIIGMFIDMCIVKEYPNRSKRK